MDPTFVSPPEDTSAVLEFFHRDIDMAYTFLDTARITANPDHRLQAVGGARKAHGMVTVLISHRDLSVADEQQLLSRLDDLNEKIKVFEQKPEQN